MELLFVLMLGLLVLGPKRMHGMLAHIARAEAEFENSTRDSSLSSRRNWMLRILSAKPILGMKQLMSSALRQAYESPRTAF